MKVIVTAAAAEGLFGAASVTSAPETRFSGGVLFLVVEGQAHMGAHMVTVWLFTHHLKPKKSRDNSDEHWNI